MALILKDRVKESSTTSGTGSITLGGAFVGFQTFATAVASGSTVYYTIHNTTAGNDGEWEVGVGTFTSPSTLSRDTVLSSSTGGTKVSFSGSSTLEVFITQPAEEAVYLNQATGLVEIGGNGTNTVSFTNINTTNLTATTVTLTAGTISTAPANSTDITNKTYVDTLVASGTHFHEPVRVESPINLNATYNQPGGAGDGVGATLTNAGTQAALVIDGITVSVADRVLVYEQTNQTQNGVYVVTDVGSGATNWILTRSADTDTFGLTSPDTLGEGSTFYVQEGNTGAGETYTCNTTGTITFGTTNITFVQISSAQVYSAGTGLNLANLTFSLVTPVATTNGGTGLTSFTANAIPYASNSSVLATGSALTFDGTNLSTTGQVISTKTGSATTGAGQVYLNGATSNRIDWAAVGTGAPAFTTRSDGTKLLLYPSLSGSITDYAIGIDAATMWSSVPENEASFKFKWYGATTEVASLTGTGVFTATTGAFTNVSGNGIALTAINASNVTSGTLDNARTTGNTANSASTIVLRDADGSFGANIVTATFSGNGATLSAINASNISSGTIANARTTAASANGASTIVLRDSGGSFDANLVNAVSLSGNAATVTGINASNIASGTIANARTTAATANGASTIVLRGASGEFAAGAVTGTSFSGDGSSLTAINATAITTGTLDNARTSAASANGASTIVLRDANGSFAGNVITGTTGTFTNISGNGVALTAINASNISSGTIANARTTADSANGASTIVSRDASGNFASNLISGQTLRIQDSSTQIGLFAKYKSIVGSGSDNTPTLFSETGLGLNFAINGSATVVGNISTAGVLTINGSGINSINASNISSGTVANARTTAVSTNTANAIVARDASGNFAGGVITASVFSGAGTSLTGTAASLTAGTASALTTGNNYQVNSLGVGTAASGTAGEIRATNNVTAFYSSDERLKDNVQVITNALAKVLQIRGVEFDWNNLTEPEDGYFVRKHDIGVIAQEVEKVLPEVVGTREDGIKAVKYDRIVPLLIEAIKELKTEVDALKGK
jgi:hypothetical protein